MNEQELRSAFKAAFPEDDFRSKISGSTGTTWVRRGGKIFSIHRAEGRFAGVELWRVNCHNETESGEMTDLPEAWFEMPAEGVVPTIQALLPAEKANVTVPGVVHATYENGKITDIVFLPHGSNAGWRGPSAELFDGDNLDVEDTDGPFWKAMQDFLGPLGDGPSIRWVE